MNTVMNSHSVYKLWNSMSTGAAVDFARKTDPWGLLFLIILITVMEITNKTGAVE